MIKEKWVIKVNDAQYWKGWTESGVLPMCGFGLRGAIEYDSEKAAKKDIPTIPILCGIGEIVKLSGCKG